MTNLQSPDHLLSRPNLCSRLLAMSGLALIAVTWRLWFGASSFPQVPCVGVLCGIPPLVDWLLCGVLLIGLVGLLCTDIRSRRNHIARAAAVLTMLGLFLLNQHRFQPWAWFLLLALVATSVPSERGLMSLRWLVCGVYVYSGWSKLDTSFTSGGGLWLVDGLLQPFGESTALLTPRARQVVLYSMPLGEIAAGICVVVPRLRRIGIVLVVLMHGALLLALGPLGLSHKPAVLIWNMTFVVLAFPLLWPRAATPRQFVQSSDRVRYVSCALVGLAAIGLPVLGQRGVERMDQWPAWVLYASWPERVKLFVHEQQRSKLPPSLLPHVADPLPLDVWCQVRVDRWSLEALNAPEYPQNRFRLAVAAAVLEGSGIDAFRIRCESATDADGRRESIVLQSQDELQAYLGRYRLNTQPRRSPDR